MSLSRFVRYTMNAFIITFAMLVLGTTCQPVVLTANNFDKEVFSGGKNAFVKFFAPWYVPSMATSK